MSVLEKAITLVGAILLAVGMATAGAYVTGRVARTWRGTFMGLAILVAGIVLAVVAVGYIWSTSISNP